MMTVGQAGRRERITDVDTAERRWAERPSCRIDRTDKWRTMKRSHIIGLGVLVFSLVSLLLLCGVIVSFCSAMSEKIRYENIRGIAIALRVYAADYGTLPEMDKWCDVLIAEADCHPGTFEGVLKPENGVCGYALNKNLAGPAFDALDDKVVLAFKRRGRGI